MVVVWIALGLLAWTAISVAAGIAIGRLIASGHRPLPGQAAGEREKRDRAEAA